MNWFKYRLPDTTEIICGASDSLIEGLGEGFAVAPFLNPAEGLITIPYDNIPDPLRIKPVSSHLPPTTAKADYFKEIEVIKSSLNGFRGKTVAARTITIDSAIDIDATFDSLCQEYPDAFVFAFSSSATGTWIGASPELLLKKDGQKVMTMALAGTRPASDNYISQEWNKKNIDEQSMVAEFICKCLSDTCHNIFTATTYTKKAGKIEHICTPISAALPDDKLSTIRQLLLSLSPTPAVCGSDRLRSLDIIRNYEHFQREMYGGFCGPCGINGTTSFYVILRSAKCNDKGICIYVGGGITPLSDCEDEWNETEMKSKTIINKLKTSEE